MERRKNRDFLSIARHVGTTSGAGYADILDNTIRVLLELMKESGEPEAQKRSQSRFPASFPFRRRFFVRDTVRRFTTFAEIGRS